MTAPRLIRAEPTLNPQIVEAASPAPLALYGQRGEIQYIRYDAMLT